MAKIYFVRHGQTDDNVEPVQISGLNKVLLNSTGLAQIEETAENLKNTKIDMLFSSPLERTKQTTEIINKYHNLEVVFDNRIIERDWGEYEGKSVKSVDRDVVWNYYTDPNLYPSVESVKNVYSRVKSFVDEIKQLYSDKNILVISHRGVARCLYCLFNGIPEDGSLLAVTQTKNGQVVEYQL